MGLEEICLPPEPRVARILCLAERMPGIVTASSCRELDRIAPAEESSAFRAIFVPFDGILPVQNDRWMTRQADGSAFRALDMRVEEQRVQRGHVYRFLISVPTGAGKIQPALAKGVGVPAKRGF